MQGRGFEPLKAEPAGLQPAPFGHSGTPAGSGHCSRRRRRRTAAYDPGVERFDVLVVGAGPAGSATAIHLARGGARVLLVDKARFPRDKPCGGGLTGRALRALPCPSIRWSSTSSTASSSGSATARSFERAGERADDPDDAAAPARCLPRRAGGRGGRRPSRRRARRRSRLRPPTASRRRVGGQRVSAPTSSSARTAPTAIVAKAAGLGDGIVRGVALEGNVAWGALDRERYRGRAVVELGVVPGGYGWVFPKGDHANLGVGGWGSEGPRLRAHLERLAVAHGVDDRRAHRREGPPAADAAARLDRRRRAGAARRRRRRVSSTRSRVTACTRRSSPRSSRRRRSSPGELDDYAARLAETLDHHAAASWAAKKAMDRSAAACFWAARCPGVFGVVAGLLAGEVRHPNEARGPGAAAAQAARAACALTPDEPP